MTAMPDTTTRTTPIPVDRIQQVRRSIDLALDQRTRLNRHIKRLRAAQKSLEVGEEPTLLDDLLAQTQALAGASTSPVTPLRPKRPRQEVDVSDLRSRLEVASAPATTRWGVPAAEVEPALRGRLGAPMPGHEFPGISGAPTAVPSRLDVGTLQQLDAEQLDGLPFGVITLDRRGRVVAYNDTESRMVGLPREAVIGRDFFGDVAPCAKVRAFEGRFNELVNSSSGFPMTSFDFVFRFERAAQHVSILISPARQRGRFHVSLFRRGEG